MPVIHISFRQTELELYEKIKKEAARNYTSESSWLKKAAADRINLENNSTKEDKKNTFTDIRF